jgi:hypothetical protein
MVDCESPFRFVNDSLDKSNIINPFPLRISRTSAIVPIRSIAVRVYNNESVRICESVEACSPRYSPSTAPPPSVKNEKDGKLPRGRI